LVVGFELGAKQGLTGHGGIMARLVGKVEREDALANRQPIETTESSGIGAALC
jgi:hypothetical protein